MNVKKIARSVLKGALAFQAAMVFSSAAYAGFSVSGTQLLDAKGQPFVMRGINHPHAWYTNRTSSFADIAATGANTVRVVLSDGQQWTRNSASDVANVISLCKANKLICVLEVHDATGSGEKAEAGTLANVAQYWVDIAPVLKGEEDYVIINIANEPFGNNQPASAWINGHKDAIVKLRNAGLTHSLLIDAANWGQDWQEIMLKDASTVAAADSLGNTFFSVHMYEVYQNRAKIDGYISKFLTDHNLPLIVGEFGGDHNGSPVDEDSILAVSELYNTGYLAWSWSGNGGCCTNLDMVINFDANNLSTWGERVINGVDGIRSTSKLASVYTGGGASPTPMPSPTPSSTPSASPSPTPSASPSPTPTPSTPPSSGSCTHEIVGSWDAGFQGKFRITNTTNTPINGWNIKWSYSDGSAVSSAWNATVSSTSPYTATNLSWNSNIAPGAYVEFGYIGTGAGAVTGITGSVCQ